MTWMKFNGFGAGRMLSDLPVICQFAVEDIARTLDGFTMPDAYRILSQEGADVIGFNCRTGQTASCALEALNGIMNLPASGLSECRDLWTGNTGMVRVSISERRHWVCGSWRGIVGGCCGTTPEHIAEISSALSGYVPAPLPIVEEAEVNRIVIHETAQTILRATGSRLSIS